MPSLRTLLVLGRTSNLPTVWSNCLAAWWLGGGVQLGALAGVLFGTTLLYLGGMYLNDAFDAGFDAQYRRERPIPSGAISASQVWLIGLSLLLAGELVLLAVGGPTPRLGVFLILAILLYDAVHKLITLSPILMAACRFLLYLVAASAGLDGVTGLAVWSAFALAFYIVGLSYIARKESNRGALRYWPCLCLGAPVGLALLVNANQYRETAIWLSIVLALWVARCLRHTFGAVDRNIGRTVSGLLAGIAWVDLLAVANCRREMAALFIVLFFGAILGQRFVPAT